MAGKIRLITFDLDDTLWDVGAVMRQAEKALYNWVETYHPDVVEQFQPQNFQPLRSKILTERTDLAGRLTALRTEFIRQAFLQAGRDEADAHAASEQGFSVFYQARNQVEFFPEVMNVLQALASNYTLAAISNGNACIEKVGLKPMLSYQYSVEQVGVAKPHPDIFLRALDHVGAAPHETIHVGDHFEQDILGAKNTGLHAVWLNRKGEPRPDTHHEIHEIASLEELPTLIHKLDQ